MLILLGLLFSLLWSSGAVAIKYGLLSASPLLLGTIRFCFAGIILLLYLLLKERALKLPSFREWKHLAILGFLNCTIYVAAVCLSLQYVSAGFFNLFISSSPFIVALLSYLLLKRRLERRELTGMLIAAIGICAAALPSLENNQDAYKGLVLLFLAIFAMALGSIYFKKAAIKLSYVEITTWQTLCGGLFMIPFIFITREPIRLYFDLNLFLALSWLVFVLSIAAMLIWFYLLKRDPVRANIWLLLTPVFGYGLAAIFLNEPLTPLDLVATLLVLIGLILSGNIKINWHKNDLLLKKVRHE